MRGRSRLEKVVPTIYIDNTPYTIPEEGHNMLAVCLSLGIDLPYFCWHPALNSVGACRQCAVKQLKNEADKRGRIVMACMIPANDGTRISIADPEVVAFRKGVIEWLMLNHPHDCPVCDEGGECHLQDMTVLVGHSYRRTRFPKRTFRNQDLGPFVNHEMNRCIQCYRCVRFYGDYAGGKDFGVFGCHDNVYFGRKEDGTLENEFAGNLVEVCPTGVFTDKTLKRHYTRKWDLATAPSVCVHCGLGCNTIPGERYGMLRRIMGRFHSEVNSYWLCDRGRFGYEFVNDPKRIRRPHLRDVSGTLKPVSAKAAGEHVAGLVRAGKAIAIGSPRASLETLFALRSLVGADRFFHGLGEKDLGLVRLTAQILSQGPAPIASLENAAKADAVLVLGEDCTNTAPLLALALRQTIYENQGVKDLIHKVHTFEWLPLAVRKAVQQDTGPFFVATPDSSKLDNIATATWRAAPDDLARFGYMVAHAIDPACPEPVEGPPEAQALAKRVADALKAAARPIVVSGTGCRSEAVIQAAANVAAALQRTGRSPHLSLTVPECNSLGTAFFDGGPLEAALDAVRKGAADTVIVAENDLFRRMDAAGAAELLSAKHVIVLDHLQTATTAKAEVVLPAATFAEASGTLVNNEGRAQRFFQVFVPQGNIHPSWRWLGEIAAAAKGLQSSQWPDLDSILAAMAQAMPALGDVPGIAPPGSFRVNGQKIARKSHRNSGRTAETAHLDIHEPKPPDDPDSPMAFSMDAYTGEPPSSLVPRFWAPAWNSYQAVNKFQIEVGGPLHGGDPGRRLIARPAESKAPYFAAVPAAFVPRADEWLIIPAHHVFGSDELSVLSPGVAELAPKPYVAMNAQDAARLGLKEGQAVTLSATGVRGQEPNGLRLLTPALVLRIRPALPSGVAAVPAGLAGMPALALPMWGRVSAAKV